MKKIVLLIGIGIIGFLAIGMFMSNDLKSIEIVTSTIIKGERQAILIE